MATAAVMDSRVLRHHQEGLSRVQKTMGTNQHTTKAVPPDQIFRQPFISRDTALLISCKLHFCCSHALLLCPHRGHICRSTILKGRLMRTLGWLLPRHLSFHCNHCVLEGFTQYDKTIDGSYGGLVVLTKGCAKEHRIIEPDLAERINLSRIHLQPPLLPPCFRGYGKTTLKLQSRGLSLSRCLVSKSDITTLMGCCQQQTKLDEIAVTTQGPPKVPSYAVNWYKPLMSGTRINQSTGTFPR